MINANEHKKLLEQITELEKNSVNYFDVEKEFFLIDSENLSQVRPKLYGYSIQRTGIYEDDNLTPEAIAGLDGRGCYVYVEVKDGRITIKQDLNGCWGIYLFRHDDYFALSNSFFRLLDHVKFKYPLTVNRDYCYHLLLMDLCSHSYSETAVNEIQIVERNAILYIDIAKKQLEMDMIDYRENTLSIDSPEGMTTLDRWVELWSNVLRGVAQYTNFIQSDLSGGFDSRIPFLLLVHSGIDLNKIRFFSIKDNLHTHAEDYEIATQIAKHYNFKLNQQLPTTKSLNYSLSDLWNITLYSRQTFHKYPDLALSKKDVDKVYAIRGYGGETIRGNWLRFESLEKWRQRQINCSKLFPHPLSDELAHSMETFLESSFHKVCDKYKIEDKTSKYILQYLYHEARSRHHFGKVMVSCYLKNIISLSPALDPEIHTLRFDTPGCPDPRLLIGLIFTRYEADLLRFPFNSGRQITTETIAYAQKINERFPRKDVAKATEGGQFHLQPRDTNTEKLLVAGSNNPHIPNNLFKPCLEAVFNSSKTFGLFTKYFNIELYRYAVSYYEKAAFGGSTSLNSVVGIVRALEDVEISQRNRSPYRDLMRFIEEDFSIIPDNESQILSKFSRYITAIILVRMIGKSEQESLQILSVSDDKAKLSKPEWLQKIGFGYMISSYTGKLEIIAKANINGQAQVRLLATYVPNPEDKSKHIPYWIDYTKLTVNEKTIFDTLTPVWHDRPYNYNLNIKAGAEIKIQVEWQPHRSDT